MLFKVYAQNCVRPKGMRIIESNQNDLDQVMKEIMDEALNNEYIDLLNEDGDIDDEKYSNAYEMIKEYWNDNKCISSGDYEIIEVESRDDVAIPNVCYSDASIIFS